MAETGFTEGKFEAQDRLIIHSLVLKEGLSSDILTHVKTMIIANLKK